MEESKYKDEIEINTCLTWRARKKMTKLLYDDPTKKYSLMSYTKELLMLPIIAYVNLSFKD